MLCDILKELREDNNLTQDEVAEKLSLTRQTISRYETGGIEPPFSTLVKMADIYKCSLDYLGGRTKERYNINLLDKDKRKFANEFIRNLDFYDLKRKK